jgi:hypothetical protein
MLGKNSDGFTGFEADDLLTRAMGSGGNNCEAL